MIRRGGVTDVPGGGGGGFWASAGNKVCHNFSTLHRCNCGSVISQLRVLASHNTSLGSVAQGASKLVWTTPETTEI